MTVNALKPVTLPPPIAPVGADEPKSALFYIGYNVLGPAFTLFTRRLIARAEAQGVDALFFVARDGWLLEQLYMLLAPPPRLRHRYLYLSRLSTAAASVRRLGVRELRLGLLNPEAKTLKRALQAFDFADDELLGIARAADIDVDEPLPHPYFYAPDLQALLENADVQRAVAERAAEARRKLRRYLAQEGFFSARAAALVDVGWNGTIQNNVARAFADDPDWPRARGFYLGFVGDAWQQERATTPKEGLLLDWRCPANLRGRAILYFLEIFEQATRADHGTTLGYRDEGGAVTPVLKEQGKDRDAEAATARALGELRRGILAYAAAEARPRHAPLDDEEVLRRLERFIFLPTDAEVEAIGRLIHTDDWGGSRHRGLLDGAGRAMLLNPRQLLERYHSSYWRPGFLRKTGGPLLAHLFHTLEKLRR
jgi:hypothetical protein